jgi:hypothetical protein
MQPQNCFIRKHTNLKLCTICTRQTVLQLDVFITGSAK